jgi:hypothetical protein
MTGSTEATRKDPVGIFFVFSILGSGVLVNSV